MKRTGSCRRVLGEGARRKVGAELFFGLADGAVAGHVKVIFASPSLLRIFNQADQQDAAESEKLGRQFEAEVTLITMNA